MQTYKNSSSGCLSRNEFAGPIFGLGHKSALELFILACRLLLLLLGVIWSDLRLLSAAKKSKCPPKKDNEQPREKCEYTREDETPPFPYFQAVVNRGLLGSHVIRHPGSRNLLAAPGSYIHRLHLSANSLLLLLLFFIRFIIPYIQARC